MKGHEMKKLLLIAILTVSVGCSSRSGPTGGTQAGQDPKPPHGGEVAEWGKDHSHAELVVTSREKGQVTVYMLTTSMKPKPIDANAEVTLRVKDGSKTEVVPMKSAAEKGDPQGKASSFVGVHDLFKKEVHGEDVEVSIKIGDKQWTSKFDHKD